MPQLDKLIFFMENMGFTMSFLFMVFYNQYVFYPKLIKNIFVKKHVLINLNTMKILKDIIFSYSLSLNVKKNSLIKLNNIFMGYYSNYYKKINFFVKLKFKLIFNSINLVLNKYNYILNVYFIVLNNFITTSK